LRLRAPLAIPRWRRAGGKAAEGEGAAAAAAAWMRGSDGDGSSHSTQGDGWIEKKKDNEAQPNKTWQHVEEGTASGPPHKRNGKKISGPAG
jgi:hypothetical protein